MGLGLVVASVDRGGRGDSAGGRVLKAFSGLAGFSFFSFGDSGIEEGIGFLVVSKILGAGRFSGVATAGSGSLGGVFSLAI